MTETIAELAERVLVPPGFQVPEEWTIHQRLAGILGEMPAIGKDARNQQQNFMYRSHDDVMNALNPLLAKYQVVLVPFVIERLTGERTTQRGTTLYEVNLHVRYYIYGPDGTYVTASAWGEGTDSGDKSTNKAMTMAFKNVLAQVFAISTAETQDADATSPEETTRESKVTPGVPENTGRVFNPGRDLLPDAPRGDGFKTTIANQLGWIRDDVNWVETINQLPGERDHEFYTRLSNATAWLMTATEGKDFPPLDDAKLMEGFAWAFEGTLIEIKRKPEPEADEAALTPEESEAMKAAIDNDPDIPLPEK
jgi:hypothetical protein